MERLAYSTQGLDVSIVISLERKDLLHELCHWFLFESVFFLVVHLRVSPLSSPTHNCQAVTDVVI